MPSNFHILLASSSTTDYSHSKKQLSINKSNIFSLQFNDKYAQLYVNLNYFWQFTYLMLQNQQNIKNYRINRNFSKM